MCHTLAELIKQGAGPLRLTYLKSWNGRAENISVDIQPGQSRISASVPHELSAESGAFGKLSIVLTSIEDGNGCVRRLSARSVEVDINRERVSEC